MTWIPLLAVAALVAIVWLLKKSSGISSQAARMHLKNGALVIDVRSSGEYYYSDDHLWSILGITAYLKETGDFAFLDEIIPFYEKDKTGQVIESAPVLPKRSSSPSTR